MGIVVVMVVIVLVVMMIIRVIAITVTLIGLTVVSLFMLPVLLDDPLFYGPSTHTDWCRKVQEFFLPVF